MYDDNGNEKYDILSADEVLNDEIVFTDEIDYTYDNRSEVYKNIRKQFSEGHGRRLQ